MNNSVFRKMRRFNQQLTDKECTEILNNEMRGVLAVHSQNGYPYAFPMDYLYYNGKLYFHSAIKGEKLDAIDTYDKVSFCITDKGFRRENEWALNFKSVIIFGRIKRIKSDKDILKKLGLKFNSSAEAVDEEIEKYISKVQLLELTIDSITGKSVKES